MVEVVAKLNASEKSMILTVSCQNRHAGSCGGGEDILHRVDEPPPRQETSKGRFCAARSFAIASVVKALLLFGLLMGSLLHAEDTYRRDLSAIQQEINQVEQKIRTLRLKSISEELKGNEYMRTEWGKYVDQIEKSEDYDAEILKLEKELESLQNKKRDLLIQYKQGQ